MAFNRKTYHRNMMLARAKQAIAEGRHLKAGTHPLCKVLPAERITENVALAASDARYFHRLSKIEY